MLWTYRVFHDKDGYCVRVVQYERDGTLIGYYKEPAVPTGRTAEELAQDIEWFKQAFKLPILTMEELDTERAAQPSKPKQKQGKNKTLEQLMAELEQKATSDVEKPSTLLTEEYLQERAQRGSREAYLAALAQVPDAEPAEYDKIGTGS